jgi:phosphoribosylformylglycinamidine cyclo-ligase
MRELRYSDVGVDRDVVAAAIRTVKGEIEETLDGHVLGAIGKFAGMYRLDLSDAAKPVILSSVDGVGTKSKIASAAGIYHTIGQDLVHHCVNDILVHGARPLFFLDYIASSRMEERAVADILKGFARACRRVRCPLIGGETAEMPGFYQGEDYDLVGFIVGIVDADRIVDGGAIRKGDLLVGVGSDGLHTNGYSLARTILFDRLQMGLDDVPEGWGCTVGEELLKVHRWYGAAVLPLLDRDLVRGMAHITGGGLVENLPRVLPQGLAAEIELGAWPVPPVFTFLAEQGPVSQKEMYRVFNMGIGFVLVIGAQDISAVLAHLEKEGERAWVIGQITEGDGGVLLRSG